MKRGMTKPRLFDRFYWPPLRRSDIRGIVIGILLVIVALIAMVWIHLPGPASVNYGFGPEWDCADMGRASAVTCIKRPPAK